MTTKSIFYSIKNKPYLPVMLYSVPDWDITVGCINKIMKQINNDYEDYSSLYWNEPGHGLEFCHLYRLPSKKIKKNYLKILKNYDPNIMANRLIDIWVIHTDYTINIIDIINAIKIISKDRDDDNYDDDDENDEDTSDDNYEDTSDDNYEDTSDDNYEDTSDDTSNNT